MEPSSKLLFVINPISGGYKKIDMQEAIHKYYKNKSHTIQVLELSGRNSGLDVYEKIKNWQPDAVIAVGGDGTIKMLAEQMQGTSIPLGILPAGSSNGLAKELGMPSSLPEALDSIMNGIVKNVDLIQLNGREICVHLSDIGLNALLVKYYAMGGVRGKWGYAKAILRVFLQRQLLSTELYTNGQRLEKKAFMIVVANARTYGTGAVINPQGDLSDGKFEVVVIKELSLWEVLKMLVINKPFDPGKIEILQTTDIRIDIIKRAHFQIDGEYKGKLSSVHAKILPAALRLIFPA
jgi:diacylglycerol kinase (ATP)